MTFPQSINASASPEVQINESLLSLEWAGVYSHNPVTDSGLTRGYNGGRWGNMACADVAHAFGASTTTYVSVVRATGALDFSTAATNYNDATNYARVETVVTGPSSIISTVNDRAGPGGVHGGGGSGGPAVTIDIDGTLAANSDTAVASQKATKTYVAAQVAAAGAASATALQGDGLTSAQVGFRNIPQNARSTDYTCVAADSGGHVFHPAADTTARTFTIPANAVVAFPLGTAITFINQSGAGAVSIGTSDTLRLAGAGTAGTRTLAANGVATAIKVATSEWIISGAGLS